MQGLECQAVTPTELIGELQDTLRKWRENKYAFQVGLKDLDFDVDSERARKLGVSLPFPSVDQAEKALRNGVCRPTTFLEDDDTIHQVLAFAPRPVGYSGFMDCVTHSLALTDQGLFEVGRFAAMNLSTQCRTWQWFLHRRLANCEEVAAWRGDTPLSSEQLVKRCVEAMIGR